jgi:hypothetical protein
MPDEQPDEADANPTPLQISAVVPLHQQPDANLVAIAQMADFVGFPMTLYMPWGIASGNAVSPNSYYRHLGESARSGTPSSDPPDWWSDAINTFAEQNFDKYADLDPTERMTSYFEGGFNLLSHINLSNARCWTAGFTSPIHHDFLRVRLTDVNAWAWGLLAT